MNIAFWTREDQLLNNYIFKNSLDPTGGNGLQKYCDLFDYCLKNEPKIKLYTVDTIKNISDIDLLVFIGVPNKQSKYGIKFLNNNDKPKILITEECKYIEPESFSKSSLNTFDIIFTFDDNYIDEIKYKKMHNCVLENHQIPKENFNKKKLACMFNANKNFLKKNSLHEERKKIINWFQKYKVNEFDLYGKGWDEYVIPWNWKILNRLNYPRFTKLRKFLNFKINTSWQGYAKDRNLTASKYKFFFAFENFKIDGYITSKIFDAFYSKTVPIYYGASNITKYIPKKCFIDYRKFKSLDLLYKKLSEMREDEYNEYLYNYELFLNSSGIETFTSDYFIQKFLKNCKSIYYKNI